MSNYNDVQDKVNVRLTYLRAAHKNLDKRIEKLYSERAPDEEITNLKAQKLWCKDEISKLELQTKE